MKLSVVKNNTETDVREINSKSDLKDIILKHNYSCGVFKDNYRSKANFEYADSIGLDIDGGLSLEDAKELFKDYKHVISTSKSHQKEKNGIIADRFRVLLFLEEPITDARDFEATWFKLNELCPQTDPACKDASRMWYPSTEIISSRNGKLITPVKAPPVEPKKEMVLPKGVRGRLSRFTQDFLISGAPKGQRHNALVKAACDAKEQGYTQEEFTQMFETMANRVDGVDWPDADDFKNIKYIYEKHVPKYEPRSSPVRLDDIEQQENVNPFNIISIDEVYERPDEVEHWLVNDLLLSGGTSVIAGPAKVGKTTLIRQLELSIIRGSDFLGRGVQQGSVIHFSFDEKIKTVKLGYQSIGINKGDPLYLHFGSIVTPNYMGHFEAEINRIKPKLVVIDAMFDLVNVDDINNYKQVKKAFGAFNDLAERTGTHIMFIHHQTKPNFIYGSGSGHTVLGSTAISASLDSVLVFQKEKDNKRKLNAEGRGVEGFEEDLLVFDKQTKLYSLVRSKLYEEDVF